MTISYRQIGELILEVTIDFDFAGAITEDVCNMNGRVPLSIIEDLEDLLHAMKSQNEKE